jgi:hypothetical protein
VAAPLLNAFTQAFGSEDLDASNLMLRLVGFLPPYDPKVLATIAATEAHLTDDRGLVYRYRSHDGLDGQEGTFLLCTFWLAQALAMTGQPDRARTVFERTAAFVNDVGLLAEESDPAVGELLGNYPQAFSHIGLINAAWAIFQAESVPGHNQVALENTIQTWIPLACFMYSPAAFEACPGYCRAGGCPCTRHTSPTSCALAQSLRSGHGDRLSRAEGLPHPQHPFDDFSFLPYGWLTLSNGAERHPGSHPW